jgi:diphthamide biosynthesis protein 7
MIPLTTIPCAGGIWRTRFHPSPSRPGDILLACMHGGFTVVRLGPALVGTPSPSDTVDSASRGESSHLADLDWTSLKEGTHGEPGPYEDIVRFEEHGSLAYGADWSRLPSKGGQSLAASCSFYDHAMHLWRA